jgi:hypothetical protein
MEAFEGFCVGDSDGNFTTQNSFGCWVENGLEATHDKF